MAALWNCLCSVQILEPFHTEPLAVYQKRRNSFRPCVFKGNVLVSRRERGCSPQWGWWSSLGLLSAELCVAHFHFWLFAAALSSGPKLIKMLGEPSVLNGGACPARSVGDHSCRASEQHHCSRGAIAEPKLLGRCGGTCLAATGTRHWQISSGATLFEGRRFFAASLLKKWKKQETF